MIAMMIAVAAATAAAMTTRMDIADRQAAMMTATVTATMAAAMIILAELTVMPLRDARTATLDVVEAIAEETEMTGVAATTSGRVAGPALGLAATNRLVAPGRTKTAMIAMLGDKFEEMHSAQGKDTPTSSASVP
jgi:hypothetical protein